MKRFVLFMFLADLPSGGWRDVVPEPEDDEKPASFDTIDQAVAFLTKHSESYFLSRYDRVQIVDLAAGLVVRTLKPDWVEIDPVTEAVISDDLAGPVPHIVTNDERPAPNPLSSEPAVLIAGGVGQPQFLDGYQNADESLLTGAGGFGGDSSWMVGNTGFDQIVEVPVMPPPVDEFADGFTLTGAGPLDHSGFSRDQILRIAEQAREQCRT